MVIVINVVQVITSLTMTAFGVEPLLGIKLTAKVMMFFSSCHLYDIHLHAHIHIHHIYTLFASELPTIGCRSSRFVEGIFMYGFFVAIFFLIITLLTKCIVFYKNPLCFSVFTITSFTYHCIFLKSYLQMNK